MTTLTHKQGFTSYNLNLLNDRQRTSLFNEISMEEILHIGISEDKKDCKVMNKEGELFEIKLTMTNVELKPFN